MKRELLGKALSTLALRLVGAALGVTATALVGRWLGAAGLGAYAYVVAALAVASIPLTQGWATLVLREASTARRTGGWAQARGMMVRGLQFGVLAALLLALLVAGVALVLPAGAVPLPVLVVAALMGAILYFDQASALRMAFLRALDRPLLAQLPEMALRPLAFIAAFSAAHAWLPGRLHVGHALASLAIGAAAAALCGWLFLRAARPAAYAQAAPSYADAAWLRSGATLATGFGITLVGAYVDQVVLGFFAPIADVGHYRAALSISLLCALPWQAINLIAGERFAALQASGDPQALRDAARFLGLAGWLATLPPVALVFGWGGTIVQLVFGAGFDGARLPLLVLASGWLVSCAFGLPRTLLVMTGREHQVLRTSAWALLVNIAACLALVPWLGLLGAALANATAAVFWSARLHMQARARAPSPAPVAVDAAPGRAART